VGKIKTGLVTERHIDKDDARPEFSGELDSLSGCAGGAEDAFSLPLKENARNVSE
jgi:cob(I)alamin adenosyltransferase